MPKISDKERMRIHRKERQLIKKIEEGGDVNVFDEAIDERKFINALDMTGGELVAAVKKAFPGMRGANAERCYKKGLELTRRPSVQKEMKKILNSMTVNPRRIVADIEQIARTADKDSDKLRALELLGKFVKMFSDSPKEVNVTNFNLSEDAAIKILERRQKFDIGPGGRFEGVQSSRATGDVIDGEEIPDRLLSPDSEELQPELASRTDSEETGTGSQRQM